jgi:rubrerythrin
MEKFRSLNEALDFAIKREEESYELYINLSNHMSRPEMKEVFKSFAAEETGHKTKLEAMKRGEYKYPADSKIPDLKIADYTVKEIPQGDLTYQNTLILAMNKEKASFRLYTDLAKSVSDPTVKNLFLGLAQEEARHKLRFEIEYDDFILKEN